MLTAYGILYDLKYIRFSCTRTKFSFVYLFINLVLVLSQKCDVLYTTGRYRYCNTIPACTYKWYIYVPLTCEWKFHVVVIVSEVETFLLPCQESTLRGSSIRRRGRRKCAGSALIYTVHCPKNSLNLRIKTEPVTVEADAMVNAWFLGQIYVNNQNLRCIRSRSDRLRFFYAEIQIIFGTVYRQNSR